MVEISVEFFVVLMELKPGSVVFGFYTVMVATSGKGVVRGGLDSL